MSEVEQYKQQVEVWRDLEAKYAEKIKRQKAELADMEKQITQFEDPMLRDYVRVVKFIQSQSLNERELKCAATIGCGMFARELKYAQH